MARKVWWFFPFLFYNQRGTEDTLQSVFKSVITSAAGSDMEIGLASPQTRLSRAVSTANIEIRC